MASKEYQRMIKLGEWLEKLFDPNIKPQLIETHFNDGLKLLNISHQKIKPFKELSNMKLEKSETIYQRLQPYTTKLKEHYELKKLIENESRKFEGIVSLTEKDIRKMKTLQCDFLRYKKENTEVFAYEDIINFLTIQTGIGLIDTIWCYCIVTANILFRFLELGGQDRICFCKQCGRFCVAKRKKRKEYCSNLCRTHASNARIAQMGALSSLNAQLAVKCL